MQTFNVFFISNTALPGDTTTLICPLEFYKLTKIILIVIYDNNYYSYPNDIYRIAVMNDLQLLIAVGTKIRKIRAEQNLSQNDLAILCDFEKASMSRIESGKSNVTLLTLQKISSALKTDINQFFID